MSNGLWTYSGSSTAGSNVVNNTGSTSTGGELVLQAAAAYSTNPIYLIGPGNANLGGTVALSFSGTTLLTNRAPITLVGNSSYIINAQDGNAYPPTNYLSGGITRSGGTGTLILYPTGKFNLPGTEFSNACLLVVSSVINNNGGPLTLAGGNVGEVLVATNGHNIGDTTITFNGTSLNPSNNFFAVMGIANALNTNANLNVNYGTYDLNGYVQTVSNLTVGASGTVQFSVNRANPAAASGYLVVKGAATISGGTLTVTNTGAAFQTNDIIQLFSEPVSGSFSTVNLPPGYNWLNLLNVNGSIRVVPPRSGPQSFYVSPAGDT